MFGEYLQLTKPKVTLLNLLVGATCFILATYPTVNWAKLAIFSITGYMAAGGCGALNCVYDAKIDSLMQRTSKRAIPTGQISPNNAIIWGTMLIAFSILISYFYFNALTAFMVAMGVVFYLPVYTMLLKRMSPWNVAIGGLAGCFAALAGWTATGATITWIPILVSVIDFFWTPGHLWALAIKKVREYRSAGVPMLPVVVGIRKAGRTVFVMNLVTVASSLMLSLSGLAGTIFLAAAFVAGIIFTVQSRGLLSAPSEDDGYKVFLASIPYLTCLMVGLFIDKLWFIAV